MSGIGTLTRILLSLLASAFLCAQAPAPSENAETTIVPDTELRLVIEDCNVTIAPSQEDELTYDYDPALFQVSSETVEGVTTITMTGLEGAKAQYDSRIMLRLPETADRAVTICANRSGVGLSLVDANLDVTGTDSAFSFSAPAGYAKSLRCDLDGSAAALALSGAAGFTLSMEVQGCSASIPEDWPPLCQGEPYQHTRGAAGAVLELTLNGCSFTIKDA